MKDELMYPAPPNSVTSSSGYVPPRPPRPTGLIVSTAVLAVALVASVIFGLVSVSAVNDDLAATQAALADVNDELAATQDDLSTAQDDLSNAKAQAATCEKAANLLAKGQTGYVRLWNRVKDAADRWRYVFDFYLYGLLRRDEVSDAQITAAWNALDECTSGTGIESL